MYLVTEQVYKNLVETQQTALADNTNNIHVRNTVENHNGSLQERRNTNFNSDDTARGEGFNAMHLVHSVRDENTRDRDIADSQRVSEAAVSKETGNVNNDAILNNKDSVGVSSVEVKDQSVGTPSIDLASTPTQTNLKQKSIGVQNKPHGADKSNQTTKSSAQDSETQTTLPPKHEDPSQTKTKKQKNKKETSLFRKKIKDLVKKAPPNSHHHPKIKIPKDFKFHKTTPPTPPKEDKNNVGKNKTESKVNLSVPFPPKRILEKKKQFKKTSLKRKNEFKDGSRKKFRGDINGKRKDPCSKFPDPEKKKLKTFKTGLKILSPKELNKKGENKRKDPASIFPKQKAKRVKTTKNRISILSPDEVNNLWIGTDDNDDSDGDQ